MSRVQTGVDDDGDERRPPSSQSAHIVMAAVENRAKEVGLAILDVTQLSLSLLQFIETSRSYTVTLSVLNQFGPPNELVVVGGSNTEVNLGLNHYTSHIHQVQINRRHFDDNQANAILASLVSKSGTNEDAVAFKSNQGQGLQASSRYLAVSAAGALLHHVGTSLPISLMPGSLLLREVAMNTHMSVDTNTMTALELVRSQRPKPGGNMKRACNGLSLYQMLNHTRTKCGARLLRASLLQPLRDASTIQARLDAVEELAFSQGAGADVAMGASAWLQQSLPRNLDSMCLNLGSVAGGSASNQKLNALIQAILCLRKFLESLPSLVEVLAPAKSALLTTVRASATEPVFSELLGLIRQVIDPEAQAESNTFMNHIQCCFAIKPEVDKFLDLARGTFCSITEQIQKLADSYRSSAGLQTIRTSYTQRRGFALVVSLQDLEQLPSQFQVLEKKPKHGIFTTQELNALNFRLHEVSRDCLRLTEQVLEVTREDILHKLHLVRRLVDNIALLDLLLSFAESASSASIAGRPYCKPIIHSSNVAPLAIVGGRHPLTELQLEEENLQKYHSNDTYLCETSALGIVTGANMSGKSTYLRQVGLIVIMAQAGSFVPASYVSLAPFAGVLARAVHCGNATLGSETASDFLMEMSEAAHILKAVAHRSLVLMDELGRGTSTCDGLAIALAVAERLACGDAYTLFTTHFPAMTELAKVQPTCKLWYFEVKLDDGNMTFSWKLEAGSQVVADYGIRLAQANNFPDEVIANAKQISSVLRAQQTPLSKTASAGRCCLGGAHLKFFLPEAHTLSDEGSEQGLYCRSPSQAEQNRNTGPVSAQQMRRQTQLLGMYHKLVCTALGSRDEVLTRGIGKHLLYELEQLKAEAVSMLTAWHIADQSKQ